jgi:hypothetical protein
MLRRGTKVEMFHVRSSMPQKTRAALMAEIPPELARCVVDYAETICHVILKDLGSYVYSSLN